MGTAIPRRLVMITRRFWPLVGGAETVMANLAAEFTRRGLHVTLLTAKWHRAWPGEIAYRGARVVRLAHPAIRFWGTIRYMAALSSWLKCHRGEYDLVYVSMLKHDAHAAIGAVGGRVPVVLRAEGAGAEGDCVWQLDARGGRRIKQRCMRADVLIGPSRPIERELIAAGYPRERIHYVPNGVSVPPTRNAQAKARARAGLGESSSDLLCPAGAPLAVYTGRLHEAKGLAELVDAWRMVVSRRPDARLWLVGEGPFAPALGRQIEAVGLAGRVVLPGAFDNVDELLLAADLFVLPSWSEGMSVALLEAMATGLAVVASDIPGNRAIVTDGVEGLLTPVRDAAAMGAAIGRLLDDAELASRLGTAARDRTQNEFSIDRTADAHLALFDKLLPATIGG